MQLITKVLLFKIREDQKQTIIEAIDQTLRYADSHFAEGSLEWYLITAALVDRRIEVVNDDLPD